MKSMQHCPSTSSHFPAPHPQVLAHHGARIPSSIPAGSQDFDIKNSSTLRHGGDDGKGRDKGAASVGA